MDIKVDFFKLSNRPGGDRASDSIRQTRQPPGPHWHLEAQPQPGRFIRGMQTAPCDTHQEVTPQSKLLDLHLPSLDSFVPVVRERERRDMFGEEVHYHIRCRLHKMLLIVFKLFFLGGCKCHNALEESESHRHDSQSERPELYFQHSFTTAQSAKVTYPCHTSSPGFSSVSSLTAVTPLKLLSKTSFHRSFAIQQVFCLNVLSPVWKAPKLKLKCQQMKDKL